MKDKDTHVTVIELPHKALQDVSHILENAGFELGTTGGGYAGMERVGKISKSERRKLRKKMAKALFDFDVQEIESEGLG